jgi:transcriptional regulator with XRE-family HTH domain
LRQAFALRASQGLTQADYAARIDADEGLISKRLKGKENMTLRTLSVMASGLGCGLVISFKPFESYDNKGNYFDNTGWKLEAAPVPPKPAPMPQPGKSILTLAST